MPSTGFMIPYLEKKLMLKEQKGEFVQILHKGNYHWVVMSNINCSKNKIDYYNSLFHGKINHHVKNLIFIEIVLVA